MRLPGPYSERGDPGAEHRLLMESPEVGGRATVAERVGSGALWAWCAVVGAQIVVNVASVAFVDVPEDKIYHYRFAALAALQFGVLLAAILVIASRSDLREALALRRPASWARAAAIAIPVTVATLALVAILDPLLNSGEAQNLAPEWDPARAAPFVVNAVVIALVAPVVEELVFRGLGFTLFLRRFGTWVAIVVTALLFAASHGLVELLPASAALGMGLAYLRSRTASVYPGIIVHVLLNLLGVLAIVAS